MATAPSASYARVPTSENASQEPLLNESVPSVSDPRVPTSENASQGPPLNDSVPLHTSHTPVSPIESPEPISSVPIQPFTRTNTQLTDQSDIVEAARRHSSVSTFTQRLYGSIDPSLHTLIEKDAAAHKTTREYHHTKQRKRLLRLTIGEWFNSLFLCVTYFVILWVYWKSDMIGVRQRRIFNALTTGNSLLLGVNLAASLRSYAKLLRWRMLAKCHRPLETFDLVMGCDSLLNVVKLLRKARNDRSKWLPSRTQLLCVLWLSIHLAITVLVGIIGLNYNLETSDKYVLLTKGNVSVLDLNVLSTGNYPMDLGAVQAWGERGTVTTPLYSTEDKEYLLTYYSSGTGYAYYDFQDLNANDTSQGHITSRYIESTSYCQGYRVQEGQYGNLSYITYNDGSKLVNKTIPTEVGPGGLLAMSKLNSTCGTWCADIDMFQAASLPSDELDVGDYNLYEARFFNCNNTVPQIEDLHNSVLAELNITEVVSRMLAGAIGWSSDPGTDDGKSLYTSYSNSSKVGFYTTPGEADMADLIACFTIGAISYMDSSSGIDRQIVPSSQRPIKAQYLHVTWRYAGSILAVIPFIHLWTLVAVIAWANHAIIKDDSHLSISKVYHSFLNRLGDRGCLLKGDEIVRVLDNPRVKYGFSTSRAEEGYMHVDVFEEHGSIRCMDGPFREGWYNGMSEKDGSDDAGTQPGLPRRYRDFDAADYF